MEGYSFGLGSDAAASWGGGGAPSAGPQQQAAISSYKFGLDSDASGMMGQQFAQTRQSILGPSGMDYYQRLGSQLMQAMQPSAPQMTGSQRGEQASGNPYATGGLTDNFDTGWLGKRLEAGSANGAKIGGMMGK